MLNDADAAHRVMSGQLLPRFSLEALQVKIRASAHTRQGLKVQGATQVSGIQPTQWQAHPIACQRGALLIEVAGCLRKRPRPHSMEASIASATAAQCPIPWSYAANSLTDIWVGRCASSQKPVATVPLRRWSTCRTRPCPRRERGCPRPSPRHGWPPSRQKVERHPGCKGHLKLLEL